MSGVNVRNCRKWNSIFLDKRQKRAFVIVVTIIIGLFMLLLMTRKGRIRILYAYVGDSLYQWDNTYVYKSSTEFTNFSNETGTPFGILIVPNIVHFIRFGQDNMTFIEAVCVLAALKHQKPDKLIVHTDHLRQRGKYWEVVVNHPLAVGVLEVKYRRMPTSIFGQELSKGWARFHAGDVVRLQVLMEEGGIFLDSDSYIVKNLDEFRKFEMTLGWQRVGISNQVIIAHKHARFLHVWYNSYRDYHSDQWFYNAGDKPSSILEKKPHLVHRVRRLMAEWYPYYKVMGMIYLFNFDRWREHYVIHLMIRHQYMLPNDTYPYPVVFDENNIFNFEVGLKYMALEVYPFPKEKMIRTEN